MAGEGLDPYERQLFAVFESCDETCSGSLDGVGLQQLCEKLQLEEQGYKLIDCLLGDSTNSRTKVTFSEFRDGLLMLLGEPQGEKLGPKRSGASPEREVSPKFVFGKKKYGRRSRPESTDQDSELDVTLEESDSEIFDSGDDKVTAKSRKLVQEDLPLNGDPHMKKRKTTEAGNDNLEASYIPFSTTKQEGGPVPGLVSGPPSLGQETGETEEECLRKAWQRLGVGNEGFLDRQELALVCECIGMEKVAEEVVQQLFEKLDVDRDGRISFDEFLLLFRGGGNRPGGPSVLPPATPENEARFLSLDPVSMNFVDGSHIVHLWEAAGVPSAPQLLRDLGFSPLQQVNLTELAALMEEELRNLSERRNDAGSAALCCNPHEALLQAALALYQTEVRCLRSSLEHLGGERDKLRVDVTEANQRASLLAQEIDDHHARLEQSSQQQIRLLEQRHADQVKALSEQLSQERDQLTGQSLALEKRVACLQEEEDRLRADLGAARMETETLERENHSLVEQLSQSDRNNAQLQREVESLVGLQQRLNELEGSREQVLPLLERLGELQAENKQLRDSNDELTVEVENLTARITTSKFKKSACVGECVVVEEGGGGGGGAIKRRGDPPQMPPPSHSSEEEESPRLGKVRRCRDVSPDTVDLKSLQICSLTHGESGVEADLDLDDSESLYSESTNTTDTKLQADSSGDWASRDGSLQGADGSGGSEDAAKLRSRIAKLEQELKLQCGKLVVCEDLKLKDKSYQVDTSNVIRSAHDFKGQLKQVFQVIRQQAVDDYLESTSSQDQRKLDSLARGKCEECSPLWDHSRSLKSVPPNGMVQSCSDNAKDVEQLEQHCRDLRSELDHVKVEIVKILTEKKACSRENCALKSHISDMRNRFSVSGYFGDCPTGDCNGFDSDGDFPATEGEADGKLPEGAADDGSAATCGRSCSVSERCARCDELGVKLESVEAKGHEAAQRSAELESSLELLRQEYEKCEDYWACKLDEERHLYEQEQKLCDEKFSELVGKIREYEEVFGAPRSEDSDRLSTIEERASLEKQVTDLEEEYDELRAKLELEQMEREGEMARLRDQLRAIEHRNAGGKLDVAVQVSDLENGSWESDRTFVVQLDGTRNSKAEEEAAGEIPRAESSSGGEDEEARRLQSLKEQLGEECEMLGRRRDSLLQRVLGLQHNGTTNHWSGSKVGGQACRIDLSVLQAMSSRLQHQEQRCGHLQILLKQQQQRSDSLLKQSWEKHKDEVSDLQIILQSTQEKLQSQSLICKEQAERLARTDILVKELYVENAYLIANVQRLEHRCQIFVQMTADSSSV